VKTEEYIHLTSVNSILFIFKWLLLFICLIKFTYFVLSYIGKRPTCLPIFNKCRHRQMTFKFQCSKRNNETTFDIYCGFEKTDKKKSFFFDKLSFKSFSFLSNEITIRILSEIYSNTAFLFVYFFKFIIDPLFALSLFNKITPCYIFLQ
jgi:hypothetical protein